MARQRVEYRGDVEVHPHNGCAQSRERRAACSAAVYIKEGAEVVGTSGALPTGGERVIGIIPRRDAIQRALSGSLVRRIRDSQAVRTRTSRWMH